MAMMAVALTAGRMHEDLHHDGVVLFCFWCRASPPAAGVEYGGVNSDGEF